MPRKSPAKAEASVLGRVAAAIEAGDFPTALADALVAWRAMRAAELADLIDALGGRCREVAIAGNTAKAFHASWMRLAEGKPSPVAIGALAASLGKLIPIAKTKTYVDRDIKRYRAFLERIAVLGTLPADPRIARAIVELLERAPITIESGRRLYQPAVDLLVELADPRSVPRLLALVARPTSKAALVRAYFAQALPPAAAAIDEAARARPDTHAAVRSLITAIAKPKAVGRGDVDELMAEVVAHPDDDGAREVLADALLEREDPRGEFITLQLRGARGKISAAERARINVLLRAHEKSWLGGDLTAVTKHRVWRRGFLDQAELQRNAAAEPATWARAAKEPRLATIRSLAKGGANAPHYESFVLSPVMRGLREVTVFTSAMIEALGRLARPLDHVRVEMSSGFSAEIQRALAKLVEDVPVRRLTFSARMSVDAVLELIAAWPARTRFAQLVVFPPGARHPEWVEHGATWLQAHRQLGVARLGIRLHDDIVVTDRSSKKLRIEHEGWSFDLARLIAQLPTGRGRATPGLRS